MQFMPLYYKRCIYFIPQNFSVGWKHTSANMEEVTRIKNVTITTVIIIYSFFMAGIPLGLEVTVTERRGGICLHIMGLTYVTLCFLHGQCKIS